MTNDQAYFLVASPERHLEVSRSGLGVLRPRVAVAPLEEMANERVLESGVSEVRIHLR